MDRELRDLHRGAREERRNLMPEAEPCEPARETCPEGECRVREGSVEIVSQAPLGCEFEAECARCGATIYAYVDVREAEVKPDA